MTSRPLLLLLGVSVLTVGACAPAQRTPETLVELGPPTPLAVSSLAWYQVEDTARSIEGRVITADSLAPLAAASVGLLRSGRVVGSALTLADGEFALRARRAGEYRVLIRRIGFATTSASLIVTDSLGVRVIGVLAPQVVYLQSAEDSDGADKP